MSLKYKHFLKTMQGIYVHWAEIIEEITFVVIHAKVIVDCISRALGHLTLEDLELEHDYEPDPLADQDLELLP